RRAGTRGSPCSGSATGDPTSPATCTCALAGTGWSASIRTRPASPRSPTATRGCGPGAAPPRGSPAAGVLPAPARPHGERAASALAAGKHVLVEKPLALTTAAAVAVAEQ